MSVATVSVDSEDEPDLLTDDMINAPLTADGWYHIGSGNSSQICQISRVRCDEVIDKILRRINIIDPVISKISFDIGDTDPIILIRLFVHLLGHAHPIRQVRIRNMVHRDVWSKVIEQLIIGGASDLLQDLTHITLEARLTSLTFLRWVEFCTPIAHLEYLSIPHLVPDPDINPHYATFALISYTNFRTPRSTVFQFQSGLSPLPDEGNFDLSDRMFVSLMFMCRKVKAGTPRSRMVGGDPYFIPQIELNAADIRLLISLDGIIHAGSWDINKVIEEAIPRAMAMRVSSNNLFEDTHMEDGSDSD